VLSGRKRWRLFAPSDWPRLFESGAWERAFFRDARCAGLFGAAAEAAAGCDDAFGGAAIDAFDAHALSRVAGGAELVVAEAHLAAGDLLFVPADTPHQVVNLVNGAEGGGNVPTTALSMNWVDVTNAEDAQRASLEAHDTHPQFRPRLQKDGRPVPGSQARWYERFRMPVPKADDERLYAASLLSQLEAHRHAAAHGERPQAAFLEPWPSFARRAWNVNVSLAALEASGELAELQRLHQVQEVAAARQQADATEEGRQQAARQEEAERQQAPTSLDELD